MEERSELRIYLGYIAESSVNRWELRAQMRCLEEEERMRRVADGVLKSCSAGEGIIQLKKRLTRNKDTGVNMASIGVWQPKKGVV